MAGSKPVASLPMYDWPEVAEAHDALWQAVATRLDEAGISAPDMLDRARSSNDVWRDPGLVLSQTCGYPFATELRDDVRIVATPIYAVEGCTGPSYSSMIVVRQGDGARALADLRGRRFAFNSRTSLSGFVAPVAAMRDVGIDESSVDWVETGGHRASLRAVAEGRADAAAIDAVCFALARRFDAAAASPLRVLIHTPLRPSLPFITAVKRSDAEVAAIRSALADALASPETAAARESLFLTGVATLPESRYLALAELRPKA